LTFTLLGQVNDADAFFNGNYDKSFIREHKIRQVTVENYVNGGKTALSILNFDRNGFLTKQSVFDSSGKKVNDYLFIYNKHGDQAKIKNIAYKLNKTYTASFNKKYNGSQLVLETSSELPFVTTHIYNSNGKRIQSTTFLNADTITSPKQVFLYNYDTNGRLKYVQEVYIESSHSSPVSTGKTEYIYNVSGNVTAVIRQGKANYRLSYDKDSLLKSKVIQMPGDLGGLNIIDRYSYTFWHQ
jgi:YD repeat-containing protein